MIIHNDERGFTLIELTMAIAIFGFILLAMTQVIHQEVDQYNQFNRQEILEQDARTALQVIFDQMWIHSFKYFPVDQSYYDPPTQPYALPTDTGIYCIDQNDTTKKICLLDIQPSNGMLNGLITNTSYVLSYDLTNKTLTYHDSQGFNHVIAADITNLTITQEGSYDTDAQGYEDYHLVKITIDTGNSYGQSFELQSLVRLN
jgi:prepilin-type N-terminal cleavage/methylation domain-containing protein